MSEPMTREQMAAILEDVLENEDLWRDSRNDLRRIMHDLRAALSCACRGREAIHIDSKAKLCHVLDDIYRLDIHISKHLPSLLPQQEVDAHVIVLLAEEK